MPNAKRSKLDAVRTDRKKLRAPRNRTLLLSEADQQRLLPKLITDSNDLPQAIQHGGILHGNCFDWSKELPGHSVDLLILDPPYNLNKTFKGNTFSKTSVTAYSEYLNSIVECLLPALKPTATIYICGDWHSSVSIYEVASRHFHVRNRITWEREKGRGARSNWKNASEDIWFCTMSDDYTFNVNAVKLHRQVLAPYKDKQGKPKDWKQTQSGPVRETHPSNLWTDITIPFWSMPENTDHPTQKSEKLIAKLMLASSNAGNLVLDPFLGSGTTTAVAEKLKRRGLGIECELEYCLLAQRRLELAVDSEKIQGFVDGVFWDRNSQPRSKG